MCTCCCCCRVKSHAFHGSKTSGLNPFDHNVFLLSKIITTATYAAYQRNDGRLAPHYKTLAPDDRPTINRGILTS